MIRFPCPGCGAQFAVAREKAGRAGKCPKCQAQFTIPDTSALDLPFESPDAAAPESVHGGPPPLPPPPAPVPDPNAPVEIAPCPSCGSRLSVEPRDLGMDIECPNCRMQYKAARPGDGPPASKRSSSSVRVPQHDPDRRDDEDDDRPSRRAARRDREEDEGFVRPSRRSGSRRDRDDNEDDYERSRPKRNEMPGGLQAVAIMLLIGGIISCLYALMLLLSCYGLLWPGTYYGAVFGVMAIVRAAAMLGKSDRKPSPSGLCVMQIICIVNCDVVNLIMGIVGLVMLGNDDVKRYYARRRRR